MRASYRERPPWLARVGDVGAGVLVAPDLVLTCAHVVPHDSVDVTLVHLGVTLAASVEFRDPVEDGDLAVLRLATPVPGAVCAPLRAPTAMSDHTYLVQGFAGGHHTESRGRIGGRVGPGWVQLEHTSGHPIARGFSGAPVWDDDVRAVVGIIVTAHKAVGGGNLIPVDEIVRRWPSAATYTGWRVDLDDAFDTHWLPRARGVEPHEPTDVWHFVGRHRALTELASYLQGPADGRVRAVVGSPGCGKSAVIARTVVLADQAGRALVPDDTLPPEVALPPVGSVTVAVHARGRTLMDVVRAIADAAEVDAADQNELLQRCGPISVVVDALDEAAGEAPMAIATMLNRLAAYSERHVVVGTRVGARGSAANALSAKLGSAVVLDLDSEAYLDHQDVIAYAQRRVGDPERAAAIAQHAGGNFLIAQLACLTDSDRLPTSVGAAVDDYLTVRFDRPQVVRDLLAPLAFAEGAGLLEGPLWLALANALSAADYTPRDLREVLTSAASYLVEQTGGTFRLFHQALDDTFRAERPGVEPVVYETLRAQVTEWENAPEYVRAHLAQHAVAAGRLDELVEDVGFLVVVTPERIVPHLPWVTSEPARAHAHVYRKTSHHLTGVDVLERAAYLTLTARKLGFRRFASQLTKRFDLPWRADVLAWKGEDSQQVLAQLPGSHPTGLWFDPSGEPAAFSTHNGCAVLYRFRDHRLVPVAETPGHTRMRLSRPACVVLADGTEFGLTTSTDGVLRKWSFTGGLRELGSLGNGGNAVAEGVAAVRTPGGRLLAVVTGPREVRLVDWTADVPVVLDRIDASHAVMIMPATLGVQDGVVFVAFHGNTGLSLYRMADDRLTPVGEPARISRRHDPMGFVTRPDGRLLLLCLDDKDLACYGVSDHGLTHESVVEGLTANLFCEVRRPDGQVTVVIADMFNAISVWALDDVLTRVGPDRSSHKAGFTSIAAGLDPKGRPVVLSMERPDSRVRLWEVDYDAPEPDARPARFGMSGVWSVVLFMTGDGRVAALSSSPDGSMRAVRVEAGLPPLGLGAAHTNGHWIIGMAVHTPPGGPVLVAGITASGRLDAWVWRGAKQRRMATGVITRAPYGLTSPIAVHDGRVAAHLDNEGKVRCYRAKWGRWRQFAQSSDTLAENYQGPMRLLFYHGAGGRRLLAIHRHGLRLYAVPARGELPVLARSKQRVLSFALDQGDDVPVVATFSYTAQVALHSLAGDVLTPWAPSWSGTDGPSPKVALMLRDGRAFVATGDADGLLAVWSCPRGGKARRLALIELGSTVQELIWCPDGTLVVWCRSGVLKLDFG
ncbi:serine protease [Actinosynnema sp. NPDC023587]|uniref:serine protease n=1 Tax=Actinosynnema sp. NPDC023587 TaxID=3154695 RepID=UPI0033C24E0C